MRPLGTAGILATRETISLKGNHVLGYDRNLHFQLYLRDSCAVKASRCM